MSTRAETSREHILESLLAELPFGVAALERDAGTGSMRYVFANAVYERHAGSSRLIGSEYIGLSGWPSPPDEELARLCESGGMWWERHVPVEDRASHGEPLPFLRVMSPLQSQACSYLLDMLIDTGAPFVASTVSMLRRSLHHQRSAEQAGSELIYASLIARVASLASSSLTLQRICQRTLSGMREQIPELRSGGIYVLESDGTGLRPLALFVDGTEIPAPGDTFSVTEETDAGRLVMHGYQLLTREAGHAPRTVEGSDSRAIQTDVRWIELAIGRRGTLLGVLELGFTGRIAFTQDEVRLYQGIAAILGNAIGNARSYEAEVRNARIADGVGRILAASMRAADEVSLGRECLSVIHTITESEFGFIAVLGEDGQLHNIAFENMGWEQCKLAERTGHTALRWPVKGLYGAVLSGAATIIANDAPGHPASAGLPDGHPALHSFMGTPLIGKRGQVFGLVALANRPGGYTHAEREAVEALAPAVVESIERFRAERQLAENARFADELNHIESIIHSSLDFETIVEEALRTGREALGSTSAALSLYEPPSFRVTHAIGFDEDVCGATFPVELETHSLLAVRSKAPVIVRDVESDPRVDPEHLLPYGIRAVMVIPLLVGGTVFGNVYYNFGHPREFSEAEVRFALRLSLSLSLAMENARLYETERTISNRLQEALLALPESVPGVEFAHAYYPATDSAKVGGDFYDIFELSYGNVGITIGDVAGKGVDAAALTSLVKNTIRAHASERGKTPAQILRLTNEVLYKTTPVESFVTVFFGILDCRDGRFVYSNGGHPTAAVVRPEGDVARLQVTGPLLGAIPEIELHHGETRLSFDDTLFLYTDGLTEARRGGELYGEERLFTALAEAFDHRPRKLMHRVIADMMAYSRGRLRDDLALLVVQRTAENQLHPQQSKFEM